MQKQNRCLVVMLWIAILLAAGTSTARADWVARYDGPAGRTDSAKALAVDSEGNVFVTGESQTSNRTIGYATIKYAPDGSELWVSRYEGLGRSNHRVRGIAVDGSGNVIVTGSSTGASRRSDFFTIKYDRDGATLWEARYDGLRKGVDDPRAVAVDSAGNVYLAGIAASRAFVLVKYDPDGVQLWAREREMRRGSVSLVSVLGIDGSDNVYLVGHACPQGRYNTFVMKYSGSGDQLWESWYTGAAKRDNWPKAMAVDAGGNVHVTGTRINANWSSDCLTLKYGPDGSLLWERAYRLDRNPLNDAYSLALDPFGSVYIAGTSYRISPDIDTAHLRTVIVKYDSAGSLVWEAATFGTRKPNDYLIPRIAADGAGNAYVARAMKGQGGGQDYATLKYDTNGNLEWMKNYNGDGNGADQPCAITVDSGMNAYVTGRSQGTSSVDFATVKYSKF